jgi:uncharacterized membrane protein
MGILNEETSSQPHHQDLVAERSAEIALNTIDILKKELEDQDIRLNEAFAMIDERQREFKAYAAPYLVDALVMSFLVERKYYINNRKRRNIRKTLIESVLKEETSK